MTGTLKDTKGADRWIWRELLGDDFPPEADDHPAVLKPSPAVAARARYAQARARAFGFDEAEHPRDAHGRWG